MLSAVGGAPWAVRWPGGGGGTLACARGRGSRTAVRAGAKGPKAWGSKRLPAYKCLNCGGGTDAIPCTKCDNGDINTFASIKECTACRGTGKASVLEDPAAPSSPFRALLSTLAGTSAASPDAPAGTRKLKQVACRTCKGQGVMLIKNSDWR